MEIKFLKNIEDQKDFLDNYWNKKHCVFKGAVSNIFSLDKDTICEMLQDSEIESRIILNKHQRELFHGPFDQQFIQEALDKDFTFIVHDLNSLFEDINKFETSMKFISNWEFDDVICTYSNKGMSLGAHFDPYNVFIVQSHGSRIWQLDYQPKNEWKDDEEIKVLKEFTPNFSIELEPGDILYIPPRVAHHGISQSESLSYSIGFKSIQFQKIAENFLRTTCLQLSELDIFENNAPLNQYPTELKNQFINYLNKNFFNEEKIEEFLDNYLTSSIDPSPANDELEFNIHLFYQRDTHLKWIYKELSNGYELIINNINLNCLKHDIDYILPYLQESSFKEFIFEKPTHNSTYNLLERLIKHQFFFSVSD